MRLRTSSGNAVYALTFSATAEPLSAARRVFNFDCSLARLAVAEARASSACFTAFNSLAVSFTADFISFAPDMTFPKSGNWRLKPLKALPKPPSSLLISSWFSTFSLTLISWSFIFSMLRLMSARPKLTLSTKLIENFNGSILLSPIN